MLSEEVIFVKNISKYYEIYERPIDRLKQLLFGWRKTYYRKYWAVNDISFEIKRGETVGIIGRNGSGKSTLLQILAGTLSSSSGNSKINGRVAALLELGSGFNPELSGRENVYTNAMLLGLSYEEIKYKYKSIVEFADIGEHIEQPVKTYSSGMSLRLAFAVVAHIDADILIVDEALAVGDAFFTQKCMTFLRKFMDKGTLLFVSHSTSLVTSLCTKVIWLENGNIKEIGDAKEVTENYLMDGQGYSVTKKHVDESGCNENDYIDGRLKYLNSSEYRNDIKIFQFDPNEIGYGDSKAEIITIRIKNQNNDLISYLIGGESVKLEIKYIVNEEINRPIVGFFIKNSSGQMIFGDNTYLTYILNPILNEEGNQYKAIFSFVMPVLPKGDYFVTAAISSGTQEEHVIHNWINNGLKITSESSSVCTGLVGIPMKEIEIVRSHNND